MSRFANAIIWGIAAVLAFAAFIVLGRDVVANGEPPIFSGWERSLVDHSTLIAWWLTWSCYPAVMVPLCIALLVVAWRAPAWRTRALVGIALLLLSWRGADVFQHFFARPRRGDWVVKHETSFSYPSSHAAIATGFYAYWGAMLYASDLPPAARVGGGLFLILLAVAICWARLALGAHYVTDLIGGALLGIAFISALLAAVPNVLPSKVVAGRPSAAAE